MFPPEEDATVVHPFAMPVANHVFPELRDIIGGPSKDTATNVFPSEEDATDSQLLRGTELFVHDCPPSLDTTMDPALPTSPGPLATATILSPSADDATDAHGAG